MKGDLIRISEAWYVVVHYENGWFEDKRFDSKEAAERWAEESKIELEK